MQLSRARKQYSNSYQAAILQLSLPKMAHTQSAKLLAFGKGKNLVVSHNGNEYTITKEDIKGGNTFGTRQVLSVAGSGEKQTLRGIAGASWKHHVKVRRVGESGWTLMSEVLRTSRESVVAEPERKKHLTDFAAGSSSTGNIFATKQEEEAASFDGDYCTFESLRRRSLGLREMVGEQSSFATSANAAVGAAITTGR